LSKKGSWGGGEENTVEDEDEDEDLKGIMGRLKEGTQHWLGTLNMGTRRHRRNGNFMNRCKLEKEMSQKRTRPKSKSHVTQRKGTKTIIFGEYCVTPYKCYANPSNLTEHGYAKTMYLLHKYMILFSQEMYIIFR
jgi:hypothetical protein